MARYRKVKNANGEIGYARLVPFSYGLVITTAALASGSTQVGNITTDPGLPFILNEMRCDSDGDTTNPTQQNLLFSLTDGESQQLFSNIPVPRHAMFGTVEYPRQLPSEVEIRPSDTITVSMTNNTGAALTTSVRITLTGYKLVAWNKANPEA